MEGQIIMCLCVWKVCRDDGLATMPKSRSLKTLHMEKVILLGTDQLPVSIYNDYSWCQISLPHCFHLPADKCLCKDVAAVKGICDSMYVSWNRFCRQFGLYPEVLEKIIPLNDNVWDHRNSNHSLDITRILVDFSCCNRKNQLLYTNVSLTKIKNFFSPFSLSAIYLIIL